MGLSFLFYHYNSKFLILVCLMEKSNAEKNGLFMYFV